MKPNRRPASPLPAVRPGGRAVCAPPSRAAAFLAFALACALVAGCSPSDNFGSFIASEVSRYGGHTNTNGVIPKLEAQWTVKRDRNGFQMWVTEAPFASIDTMMQQMYGKPRLSDSGSNGGTGRPHRVWAAADIGVAIQLIGETNRVEIICVRAMRDTTEVFQEMDRPWWKFW